MRTLSLTQFPIGKGDYILADRGYSTTKGIRYAVAKGAYVTVRVHTASLPLYTRRGTPFDLLEAVSALTRAGTVRSWPGLVIEAGTRMKGRVCVIRKSRHAIHCAQETVRTTAARKGRAVKPCTLEYAKYIILFTTFPEDTFPAQDVLQWYRIRWQVELVFKRFKSLAQLGHLPKYDEESAKAWLYGKLLVALLLEKLRAHAESLSPWGYELEESPTTQCVA